MTLVASNYTPPEYFAGWLAESWKITDTQSITFYLRQGVHFMKKAPVNGREFTADDVTYSLAYFEGLARNTMYRSKLDAKAIALQLRSMAALAQGAKRRSGARLIEQLVRLPEV